MSLVSISEGVRAGLVLKRHVVCFTGTSNDQGLKSISDLLSHMDNPAVPSPQSCSIDSLPDTETQNGISCYLVPYSGTAEIDYELQNRFALWLHKSTVPVILVLQDNPLMIPYLRHQFWFACGEDMGQWQDSVVAESIVDSVYMHHSIRRYILDLIVHLRMHRLSKPNQGGGAHSRSLSDMTLLCKWIALTSGSSFITPDMVQTACERYFPWHLQLIESSKEDPSVMYGSQEELVDELINRFDTFAIKMAQEYKNPLFKQLCIVQSVMKDIIPAT